MASDPFAVTLQRGDALILVDVQYDFLPGGSLAVPRGDEVVHALNRYIALFQQRGLPVFATRDWHPPQHCSFREQGGPWPPHCIAGSDGARFAALLDLPCDVRIISKATATQTDAYSGFEGTELTELLRQAGVSRVFVGGLATDYCVLNTVRDARRFGFGAMLLADAIRAVDVAPGDGERAIAEMLGAGAVAIEYSGVTG
jgi:nicotinamidase/pyrazinamidase